EDCEREFPPAEAFGPDHESHCWRADEVRATGMGTGADPDHLERVEDHVEAGGRVDPETGDLLDSEADDTAEAADE
ncbi:MAG: hypothetical protein ABEL76_08000, partial [Bradymonadaceae bacterium]